MLLGNFYQDVMASLALCYLNQVWASGAMGGAISAQSCFYHAPFNPQELHPKSGVIVLGDKNAHHEEWIGSRQTDAHGDSALEFAVLNNLHQIVDLPTRIGKDEECSKIYLFLTTSPGNPVVPVSPLWDHPTTVCSQLWPTTDFQHPARQANVKFGFMTKQNGMVCGHSWLV